MGRYDFNSALHYPFFLSLSSWSYLDQDHSLETIAIVSGSTAAPAVALTLPRAGQWPLPVHQHPAPATPSSTVAWIPSSSSSRCDGPGGEGVEGDILPGARAPCPLLSIRPVAAVSSPISSRRSFPPAPAVARPSVPVLSILAGLRCERVPATDGHVGVVSLFPHIGNQHRAWGHLDTAIVQIPGARPAEAEVRMSARITVPSLSRKLPIVS